MKRLIKNLVKDDCSGYDPDVPLNTIYEDPEYNNVDPVYEIKIIDGSLVLEFGWNIRTVITFISIGGDIGILIYNNINNQFFYSCISTIF